MTYQPFLPEVAAGSIEARHAVVALRRHLKRTKVVTAKVTGIDHADKVATITPIVGEPYELEYDQIVVTAGAVSRTFPIPGIADNAIGLKTIEEAVAIRDRLMSNFDKASRASCRAGARPAAHGRRGRRRLRRHRGVRRAALASPPSLVERLPAADLRRHALPPHRGDGPHHARGLAEDERVGAQGSRQARRLRAPRHAGHRCGRRQRRALDRRGHPDRPDHLDRRRHGQPDRRARRRPAGRRARSHPHPRRPARRHRGRVRRGRLGRR